MRAVRDHQGFTLVEVLIAATIVAVGLLALVAAFPVGYVDVSTSGGQSKATAYVQQKLEELKNQGFPADFDNCPAPLTVRSVLPDVIPNDPDYTRCWTIAQEPGTNVPNRLTRIQVTVNWGGGGRPQSVTLETMRAE